MKLKCTNTALTALQEIPARIRKAFYKQAGFLLQELHHPSLRTKKYSQTGDTWQARVNKSWRFYFRIIDDTYLIEDITPHPKQRLWVRSQEITRPSYRLRSERSFGSSPPGRIVRSTPRTFPKFGRSLRMP